MTSPASGPALDPASLSYTAVDAARFEQAALAGNVAILGLFIAYRQDWLTLWMSALLLNIVLTRWMLAVHELFHIVDQQRVHPWVAAFLIPFTPLNLGYGEYRAMHWGHHRHTGTDSDPDAFHIRGGHALSLLGALSFPEQSSLRYVMRHGLRGVRTDQILVRLGLFVALASWGGWHFLWFWIVLRVNYAVAIWVFFHHLHYREGRYGTFSVELPTGLLRALSWIYGPDSVQATLHHDVHHRWPRVAVWHLANLRGQL